MAKNDTSDRGLRADSDKPNRRSDAASSGKPISGEGRSNAAHGAAASPLKKQTREEKLAEALRQNLRRRKQSS